MLLTQLLRMHIADRDAVTYEHNAIAPYRLVLNVNVLADDSFGGSQQDIGLQCPSGFRVHGQCANI